MHLLIPLAASLSPGCRQAMASLALPHLARLLSMLEPQATDQGEASSLSPPHERVLARTLGLPLADGHIPFAAQAALRAGIAPDTPSAPSAAWAFLTPCHWQLGQDHVSMTDPALLELAADESQALLDAMRPFFAEDGIELLPWLAQTWLARSARFDRLASASLDRVAGRDLHEWMPRGEGASLVRRLQSEMQMLLYTQPVNEARAHRGQLPVNSFWVSGCGALPAGFEAKAGEITVDRSLCSAALADDAAGWAQAWQQLDAGLVKELLKRAERREPVQLTLCGERGAITWAGRSKGAMASLLRPLRSWWQLSLAQRLEPL
jgi:hypothetical protein